PRGVYLKRDRPDYDDDFMEADEPPKPAKKKRSVERQSIKRSNAKNLADKTTLSTESSPGVSSGLSPSGRQLTSNRAVVEIPEAALETNTETQASTGQQSQDLADVGGWASTFQLAEQIWPQEFFAEDNTDDNGTQTTHPNLTSTSGLES